MSFIERFKDKFYFIGCDITIEIINHTEVKKISYPKQVLENLPNPNDISLNISSWIHQYNAYASHCKCYLVLTGKISGITVLDFDTIYSYKTFCKNVPNFESYFTVRTKKGYHVYCLYNPNLKTTFNVLKNLIHTIDIINDIPDRTDLCGNPYLGVICPPSSYYTLNGILYIYQYIGGTIKPVPKYLFDCLKILKGRKLINLTKNLNFLI